jgi:ketosteroid isomerase-like protein
MSPKLAAVMVSGSHLVPVILRREVGAGKRSDPVGVAETPGQARCGESPVSGDEQSPFRRQLCVRPDRTVKENDMAVDNEQIVRKAYEIAEDKDLAGWAAAFTADGTFTDESIGVTWQGPDELPEQVENYARAFPDMHRELYRLYVSGDIVVVQLALQGTHLGPLHLPAGTLPPTGKRMDAPCCDVFELAGDKIKRFDCYPEGSVVLTQLGVIGNLSAALKP